MMLFILLLEGLFLCIGYTYIKNQFEKKIISIFNIWWGGLLIYSKFAPMGGYKISNDTYLLIALFIFVFNLVYIMTKPANKYNFSFGNELKTNKEIIDDRLKGQYEKWILNNKTILMVLYIVVIVLLYYAIRYRSVMSNSSILESRNERFYVGSVFRTTIELLFFNFIVSAFRFYFAFVISFSVVFSCWKNMQFVLCSVGLGLYSSIGAGRFPLVLLLIDIFWLLIIKKSFNRKQELKKNVISTIKVIAVFAVGIVFMSYLTAFRRGELDFNVESIIDNSVILKEQIINYSIGPLSGLSYLYDTGIMKNHLFFGRAVVLNGIDELISYILSFAGVRFSCAKYELAAISNVQYSVGNSSFNALFTCIYWFYSDFGIIGIILFTGLFAWSERKGSSLFEKNLNVFSLMIVIHLLYFLLLSNMIWQVTNVDSLIFFVAIYYFYKKCRVYESV